ncbi:MAG: hypothetical protein Q7Q71_05380 [Verrucomicrobiota bacterium JB023]|nr:hypothetical protein [Verrucomicrobiota bacterium JB023]
MSSRERNLLIILAAMAFLAVNLLGYKVWYEPQMQKMERTQRSLSLQVEQNEIAAADAEFLQDQRDWLARNEPEPTTVGSAQTQIQQLAENEARRRGLTIKRKDFGSTMVEPGYNYHRARYQIEVNGVESSIFQWIDRLHNPAEFRAVTYVRLNANRDDGTKADAEIYIDQWFVPEA